VSGSATVQASPSKYNRRSNDSGFAAVGSFDAISGSAVNGFAIDGGFATIPNAAENTKKVETISPLSAAMVLKVNFIKLLPSASRPFLTPLAESALREFACDFYAEEKAKEKSLIQIMSQTLPRNLGLSFKPCLKYKRARVSRLSVMT
jgi:hypothetical protein